MSAFVKPQKPKKNVSSFWLYFSSVREEVSQELKEKSGKSRLGDISKVVGERWKTLAEAERKVFEDKAAEDKERYDAEMQEYNDACDPTAALRRKYAHLIPKKPLTPHALFNEDPKQRERAVEALKAEGKETGERQVTSKLAALWKEVGVEEKNFYMQAQTKQHLEFLGLQKVWQATPEFKEIEQAEKAKQEVEKLVEMAKAAEDARVHEQEEKAAKKRTRPAAQNAADPTPKRQQTSPQSGGKTPLAKAKEVPPPCIDEKLLKEAAKLGMEVALQNLAGRPEVMASKKSSRAILDALKTSGGLVNPAKRLLLGL